MKRNKGFTLIELMVVIAIIAIIAAIAIPNLIQSRIRANEAIAVTVIKAYCTAQVQFEVGKQGNVTITPSGGSTTRVNTSAGSIYAENYRNLFYGVLAGSQALSTGPTALQLISQAHADAFANGSDDGSTTVTTVTGTSFAGGAALTPAAAATPYQGYLFLSPIAAGRAANFFAGDFAQIAVPNNSTSSGTTAYWVGQQGNVMVSRLAGGQAAPALVAKFDDASPSAASPDPSWESL